MLQRDTMSDMTGKPSDESAMPTALEEIAYPQAETTDGRLDSLDPDSFRYEITSRETPSTNG